MMNQGTAALPTSPEARTNDLVEMIQRGHPAGLEQLYTMAGNFTYFLMRQLGNDELLDKVHDVFVSAATAITTGRLRDSSRLTPFLTTLTRFYTYGQIDRRVVRRKYVAHFEHTNIPAGRRAPAPLPSPSPPPLFFYPCGQLARRVVRPKYVAQLEHTNIPDVRINL